MPLTFEDQDDYNLFCQQRLGDPYPLIRAMRCRELLHWCETPNTWLAFRYDDTMAAVKDARFLSGRAGVYDRAIGYC